jgi:hypothetical protein
MNGFTIGGAVVAITFASGVVGLNLYRVLPARHLSKETHDVIKLGTGMLSVLASLVLGLLISTAKTSYDSTSAAVRAYAADLTVLDEVLRDYGEDALPARRQVSAYAARLLSDVWTDRYGHPFMVENRAAGNILEGAFLAIHRLTPASGEQQALLAHATSLAISLLRERRLLVEGTDTTIQPIVIAILVLWLGCIFVSFGINGPRHATMYGVFVILAIGIGSAMFVILELNSPFEGPMRISAQPIRTALAHMVPPEP